MGGIKNSSILRHVRHLFRFIAYTRVRSHIRLGPLPEDMSHMSQNRSYRTSSGSSLGRRTAGTLRRDSSLAEEIIPNGFPRWI